MSDENADAPVIDRPVIVLRDYQERGVAIAGQLWAAGVRRILLQLPTGSGKTVIAARFLSGAAKKGRRALFLAHRREIVAQSFAKLVLDGVPMRSMGCLMADGMIPHPDTGRLFNASNPSADVIVASIPSWYARPTKPPADVVFIDEAHHCEAKTWRAVIDHYVARGAVVIGLTATPIRGDGKGLDHLFDQLVCVEKMSVLVAAGHLCKAKVFVGERNIAGLRDVKVTRGDYETAELQKVMRQEGLVADIIEQWQKHNEGRTTVVFASGVEHSLDIVRRFTEAGVKAEHLDGKTSTEDRAAILARLANGETQVVSNAMVLTEGWDLPRAKLCVLARPTKSKGLYLQMSGRVLRPWGGVTPKILDHSATAILFGPPDIDHDWESEWITKEKKKGQKRDNELGVSSHCCKACHCLLDLRQRVCPECGEANEAGPIVEAEGDLVELKWQEKIAEVATPTAEELLQRAKARSEARNRAEQERLRIADGDEVRRAINRAIGVVGRRLSATYEITYEEALTEINRLIYRRLGNRSRSKATRESLELELAWIGKTNPATGAALIDECMVSQCGLKRRATAADTAPVAKAAPPAPKTPSAEQLSLLGIEAPPAPRPKVPSRPVAATAPAAPAASAPVSRSMMDAMDRAEAAYRARKAALGEDDDDDLFRED